MKKEDLKKILAGVSIAGLISGSAIGCTSKTQESPPVGQQQEQQTSAPQKEAPAPGGGGDSEKAAGGTKTEPAPGG